MTNELEQLLKQISLGEDSVLELKEIEYKNNAVTGPNRNSMADEMAAMANSHGGIIVLGVNDKTHTVTGLPLEKLDLAEIWVRDIANNLIKPPLMYRIKKLSVSADSN